MQRAISLHVEPALDSRTVIPGHIVFITANANDVSNESLSRDGVSLLGYSAYKSAVICTLAANPVDQVRLMNFLRYIR